MTFRYMIDTDTFIYIKNRKPPEVLERFSSMPLSSICISVITYGELFNGCEKSQEQRKNHKKLAQLIKLIPVQIMTADVGIHYGKIRASLEKSGTVIGNNDHWIAAHARTMKLRLVTNNTHEFSRVPDLVLENWVG